MNVLTILVVDDDPMVLDTTCEMIATIANVLPASSPGLAIDMLGSAARVDVLLPDVMMHPMTGIELAQCAKTSRPDLNVVLTSGYPADMLTLPPNCHFMAKPYRLARLHSILLDI